LKGTLKSDCVYFWYCVKLSKYLGCQLVVAEFNYKKASLGKSTWPAVCKT